MKKILAKVLLFTLLFNLFPIFWGINNVLADDSDWTANLNLNLSSNVVESSIVGNNFTYNFTLTNQNTSEWDAFNAGFILSLPDWVDFVSAWTSLWNFNRNIANNWRKLYFFQTDDFLLKWISKKYSVNLTSSNIANLSQNYDISVLAYADDNIYWRGAVPSGAPAWTLPWWVDLANTSTDPSDLTFPDNIDTLTDLSTLPFVSDQTRFIPFDIEKTWAWLWLIGKNYTTTITIKWNSLWELKNFALTDVIPDNRKFVWFTQTWSVWNINVSYNTPNNWEVTLDLSNITVATWTDLEIQYETLALAYPINSYSGSNILLNTGSYISDRTSSINKVNQVQTWTWNNWTNDIPVDATTLVVEKTHNELLWYAQISKWVSNSIVEVWDILTYTLDLNIARNVAFSTNWSGTYISDILPDGLSFSGVLSSVNNWSWSVLTFISSDIDTDWDTTLLWKLNSWELKADDDLVIKYEVLVDGLFENSWDTNFENSETLVNTATFFGTISESNNNEEWGYTEPNIINTTVTYNSSASVKAPDPTNKKYIVSITSPDWSTTYDSSTWLPASIPVWSEIQYALVMNFPNVEFIDAKLIDALPLIVWPNDSVYDYAFQTDNTLKDINNISIEINDDNNDWNSDSSFNSLDLTSTGWILETPANNIEFDLGSWSWARTFAITFKVKILDVKPSWISNWISGLKNVSFASVNDDQTNVNPLEIQDVQLNLWVPELVLTKTMSGSNIEAWSNIDYTVEIQNIWKESAYIENLIDTLPNSLGLQNYLMTGSWFTVNSSSLTQSWNILDAYFNTWALNRSVLPANSSIKIDYTVKAWTGLIINNQDKINTVTLDYFASDIAVSNDINNYWPLEAESNFITKQPIISRTVFSTSESGSISNNLEIWEEVTFKTEITLPNWTYNSWSFVDDLWNNNLLFLTWWVDSFSWSLSFSNWTWTTSIVSNDFKIDFWTIINSDLDDSTLENIVIYTTSRVKKNASTWNNKKSEWKFNYSLYDLTIKDDSDVNILEPNIVINKIVNPTTWNAGDILNYTVSLENDWLANAYDLVLKDSLDTRFTFVTWSLVLNGFTGSENDFLSNTWITLAKLDFWTSTWITFQVIVNQNVAPKDDIPNTANLDYSSLDADNSINEKTYTWSSLVNFTIDDILLTHNIISTNNADTGTWFYTNLYDLAIWEEAEYKTIITFPESSSTGFVVTQTLAVWYEFLTGSVLAWDLASSLSGITINNNIITYNFNPIIVNSWSWITNLELTSNLIVTDNAPSAWPNKWLSTLNASWDINHSKSIITNLDIVEPNILITKEYDIISGDAWDVAQTTITITNNGSAPAYDLSWTDNQPNNVTTSWWYLASSWATILNIWDTITYNYTTTLDSSVTAWEVLTWTASIDYTSFPLINWNERSYFTNDTDSIQVVVPNNLSAILNTVQNVAIWDVSSYTIKIPVAEWTTNNIKIEDLLPSWIAVNTWTIVVTNNSITLSGSTQPIFTSTGMIWEFTNIVNNDNDNSVWEEIIITFDTVLLNLSDNNDGDTKNHQVKALYNWWNEKTATTANLIVVEPNISLNITNNYTQVNNLVKYTFSLTNTWTSSWFDLDLSTLLPTWVNYTWSINITNSGSAINLVKNWNNFNISELPINTWNPLTFEIYADVDENHNLWDILTLTWNLDYTSQNWNYIANISWNTDNTERNWNWGINDYNNLANTSFVYSDAILDEKITVIDDNWGNHLGWETYTYTVTLTNTWNINLTNVSTIIDIPDYLSGSTFSLQSVPAGSTNSYNSTGWINNNWILTLNWINIVVWDSVTIVYKINSNQSTPDWTTIITTANVSDTVEWAIWWNPSIPLTIIAPKLETTSVLIDDNWWNLYQNEIITHNSSVKNIWSSTWTNMQVVLNYNTWTVDYISGSLDFGSWTLVNTWSIVIDENNGTISFVIISIAPNFLESITFKTKATWPIDSKVKTKIISTIGEWFDSNTTGNELIILAIPIVSHSWGWYSNKKKKEEKQKLEEKKKQEEENEKEKKRKEEEENKIKKIEKEKINKLKKELEKKELEKNKLKLKLEYEKLLEKEKLLKQLLKKEKSEQKSFAIPKILPKTWTSIEERTFKRNIKKIETELPKKEIFRLAWSNNDDLDFWKQVLPKIDQNRDEYLVIPSNGLVIPVNKIPENTSDFSKMISWKEIHVNDYLKTGVMEYPNSWELGKIWNKVIFWHSSYWKSDNGRYKTHFGKIIEMDNWEEIWVYKKINWKFKLFKYIVEKSYNTKPTDVGVLNPTNNSTLTLFTCTPIWGIVGRWIVKANYIWDEDKNEKIRKLKEELYWLNISYKYKKSINNFISKIEKIDYNKKDIIIIRIINKIDLLLNKAKYKDNKKINNLLKYLRIELLKTLFEK